MTPVETIQNWLVNQLAEQLSLDANAISTTEPLTRYGLDSIDAVTIVGDLEDWLDMELPSTLFWDHPTIAQSSQFLADNYDVAGALNSEPQSDAADPEPVTSGKGWGGLFGRFGS
ncbi:MAG: acyl carrier protein [Cyanophyceae cyanobacterium]